MKCDSEVPCLQCRKDGSDCVKYTNDKRKKRYSAQYVLELEQKVAQYEEIMEKARNLVDLTQELLTFKRRSSQRENESDEAPESGLKSSVKHHPVRIESTTPNDAFAPNEPTGVSDRLSVVEFPDELLQIQKLNQDPDVLYLVKSFFTWQYPDHNSFVYREAFLIEFFNPKINSSYCSSGLILAICAMASCMSSNETLYLKSINYYSEAKESLLSQLSHPRIASIQALFLLAFYDIGQGNNTSCWMLLGIGVRMGFEIFQLHPKLKFLELNETLSSINVAIRSRIYWGCYLSDHLISLLLGRPSSLKSADTTIPETNDLPDITWIAEYSRLEQRPSKEAGSRLFISSPMKSIIELISISNNILNDIFTDTENSDQVTITLQLESKINDLLQYNSAILQWKLNLPPNLQWDSDSLKQSGEDPSSMILKFYYFILLLCLNRPFLQVIEVENADENLIPSTICKNIIEDLIIVIQRFKSVNGLRKSSILIVYSSIISVSVLFLLNPNNKLADIDKEKIEYFLDVLHECSKTWKFASKSYHLIKAKLQRFCDGDIFQNPTYQQGEVPFWRNQFEEYGIPSGKYRNESGIKETNVIPNGDQNLEFLGGPPHVTVH